MIKSAARGQTCGHPDSTRHVAAATTPFPVGPVATAALPATTAALSDERGAGAAPPDAESPEHGQDVVVSGSALYLPCTRSGTLSSRQL